MPDPVRTIKRLQPDALLKIAQLPLSPPHRELVILVNHRDPRGVVSAILQFPKSVDDQRHHLFVTNVTDNSTHK